MDTAAQGILAFAGANTVYGISVVLWSFSLMSAFINNIPLAAAFIPVLKTLGNVSGRMSILSGGPSQLELGLEETELS